MTETLHLSLLRCFTLEMLEMLSLHERKPAALTRCRWSEQFTVRLIAMRLNCTGLHACITSCESLELWKAIWSKVREWRNPPQPIKTYIERKLQNINTLRKNVVLTRNFYLLWWASDPVLFCTLCSLISPSFPALFSLLPSYSPSEPLGWESFLPHGGTDP